MNDLHPIEAQQLLQSEPEALLLDVREPWEVALASLPLPTHRQLRLPMASLPARLAEIPRAQPVVCICHHGARSAQVVAFLMSQGYARVYNLAGGIEAWSTHVDSGVPRY